VATRFKVKEAARSRGYSMYKLQQASGVDIRTLRILYRNPPGASVTTSTLDRIATTLQVDISELVESIPPGDDQAPTVD
jgi:DNA-binding Xre family transcriptional regulator